MKRALPWALILILAAGGLLRVGHWLQVREEPFFSQLVMDSWEFDGWAVRILGGDWLGREVFFQPPLYPYLLALIFAVAGHALSAVYLFQIALGLAGLYALYRAGRRLLGESHGLAAAGLAALYGPFIFYDVQVLKESVAVALVCFLLWALAEARDRERAGAWIGAGALTGLIALLRENMLLVLPVLLLLAALDRNAGRSRLRNTAALLGGCLLVLFPVAVRNGVVGGVFLPTTFQGGVNFYIGNNPDATGWYRPIVPGKQTPEYEKREPIRVASGEVGRPLTPAESSSYWMGKALGWVRAHPGHFLRLQAVKAVLFWEWYERPDAVDYYYVRTRSFVLGLPLIEFGAISLLALAGMVLMRRRWRVLAAVWAFILAWMGSTVVFFLFSRYRLPVVPALMILAAVPLVEGWPALRKGMDVPRLLGAAGIALALAAPHLAGFEYRRDLTHYNLAVIYERIGRLDEAERNYREALAADPRDFLSCLNLGNIASRRGDNRAALDWYLKAAAIQPETEGVHIDLGRVHAILGDIPSALAELNLALAINPESVEALHNKAVLTARQGDFGEARRLNRRVLELAPDWQPALALKTKLEKISPPLKR